MRCVRCISVQAVLKACIYAYIHSRVAKHLHTYTHLVLTNSSLLHTPRADAENPVFWLWQERSGCAITTRGNYFPPGHKPKEGEKKLYLTIDGDSEKKIEMAKMEITRILKEELHREKTTYTGGCNCVCVRRLPPLRQWLYLGSLRCKQCFRVSRYQGCDVLQRFCCWASCMHGLRVCRSMMQYLLFASCVQQQEEAPGNTRCHWHSRAEALDLLLPIGDGTVRFRALVSSGDGHRSIPRRHLLRCCDTALNDSLEASFPCQPDPLSSSEPTVRRLNCIKAAINPSC